MSFTQLDFVTSCKDELHKHLKEDFNLNQAKDKTLHIIDNYNIKTLKGKSVNFYYNSFKDTSITQIIFYYQVNFKDKDLTNIKNLSRKIDVSFEDLTSFISIFCSKSKDNYNFEENLLLLASNESNAYTCFKNVKNFMERFKKIGINVKIHPYDAFSKNYIHGRYWINVDPSVRKGTLVDGSLNCYPNALILAQIMDEENYRIISNVLSEIRYEKSTDFIELDLDGLKEIYYKICNYFGKNRRIV